MSLPSWKNQLAALLRENNARPRLALVGVGSELNGDDAAGVAAIRLLRSRVSVSEAVLLVEAGPVPENFTGVLRRFAPDQIVLIDAGNFGGEAGEIRMMDWRTAEGFSASTHTLPLSVFAGYLEEETGGKVTLLLIQPAQIEFAREISPMVAAAVGDLVEEMMGLI